MSLVNDLQKSALTALLEAVFAEPALLKAFFAIGANRRCHHTERSDLLRHSLEVAEGVRGALRTDGQTNGLEGEAAIVVALIRDLHLEAARIAIRRERNERGGAGCENEHQPNHCQISQAMPQICLRMVTPTKTRRLWY